MAALAAIAFSACSSSDDDEGSMSEGYNVSEGEIMDLNEEALGNWDKGYVVKSGVFLSKVNGGSSVSGTRRLASADEKVLNTETLFFSNKEGTVKATLLINKEDNRPLQFVMKDCVLNFSFLNDEVLELVYQDGSGLKYVDQIQYNKEALDAALAAADYKNGLQNSIFYFVKVTDLSKLVSYPSVVAAIKYFHEALGLHYNGNETTAQEAGVSVGSDGVANVAKEAEQFENEVSEKVYNTITIWTGQASFKVGGSSCTLSGTVFCSDPLFAEAGEFGILCDKDPDKLVLGQAEFEGTGTLKDGNNFDVDFRGFKSLTTYYYRAFYKFKDGATRGDLVLDAKQKANETTIYDQTIKQFTTDENRLTVDVVMVMDISGSMSGEINMVKNNATSFYNLFKEKCDAADIHLVGLNAQVITFSDINVDGEDALTASGVYNLQNAEEKSAFESFVDDISLSYGGDAPESALEALGTAFSRPDWGTDDGFHRQVVILWTDATYKVVNTNIWGGSDTKEGYRAFTYDEVYSLWNAMPTGRRMILFAPYGQSDASIDGDWRNFDSWKNVLHIESTESNLRNFGTSLDFIISELTGKESTESAMPARYARLYSAGKRPVVTGNANR